MMLLVQFTKLVPWALMNSRDIAFWKPAIEVLLLATEAMSSMEGMLSRKKIPRIMNMMRAFPIIPKNFIGLRM